MAFYIYILIGCCAGFLSGLLGIGGGLVVVPALVMIFAHLHIDANLMQLATGTSLAVMIFTTFSSSFSHFKKKAIDWPLIKIFGSGVVIGALIARSYIDRIPSKGLGIIFILFVCYIAYKMFTKSSKSKIEEQNLSNIDTRVNARANANATVAAIAQTALPNNMMLSFAGVGIGVISSLLGLGGSVITIPFLMRYNYSIHKAIAVAVTSGFLIALSSSIKSLVVGGFDNVAVMPLTLGSIYLPALLGISIGSVCAAPFGVKVAHMLSEQKLKRTFAIFLVIVVLQMSFNMFKNF